MPPPLHLPGLDTRTLSEQGLPMTVLAPNGQPYVTPRNKTLTLTILGPDSARYRRLSQAQMRAALQRRSAQLGGDGAAEDAEVAFARDEAEIIDLLAACTTGWGDGFETAEGEPIPFSPEAVRAFYAAYPHVRDQADVFLGSRARFTQAS